MDAEMEIDAPPAGQGPAVPVPVSAADAGDDTEDEDAEDETGNAGKDEMDVEPQKPQPRRAKALVDSDDEVADTPQADTATQKEADDDAAEKVLVKGGKKVVALADSDEEEEEGRAIPKRASQRASSAAPEEEEEDKESEDDLPIRRKGAKGRASRTAEAPDAEVEEEAGGGAKARGGQRRLVQRNDDATGSDSDGDAGAAAGGGAASPEVPQSKAEKRAEMEGMAAMARKRAEAQEPPKSKPKEAKKGTKRQEAKKAEEKEGSSKKSGKRGRGEAEPKKGAKTAKGKKGEGKSSTEGKELEAVLALMTRHLTNVIAKAVLEKDETLTKRVCRERLEEVFGDRVAANKAFVNEEVTRLIGAAQLLTEPELGAQLDTFVAVSTEEVEGVLAQLSSPVGKEDKGKKGAAKSSKGGTELEAVMALMTRHLTHVISQAVLEKDATLTKKVCRERLGEVFGDRVAENKAFVNEEVGRIVGAAQAMSEPDLGAQLDNFAAVSIEEVEGVRDQLAAAAFEAAAGAGSGSGSDSADSSSSEDEEPSHSKGGKSKGKRAASPSASDSASESEDDAPSRRKAKPKSKASRSGIFSGIVAVPAGDRMIRRVKELRGLVLEHGGKMQVAVTSKVTHVVVAKKDGSIASSDPRVKSARKHGAVIVFDSFFQDSAKESVLANAAEYAPDIGAAASKKSDKRKAAAGSGDDDAGSAGGGEGGGDSSDGGSPKAKKRRAAKPRVESDWDKEFRSRFGYAKEARTRPFSYKDTVVPGATFFQDVAGQVYNAYLTQTEMPVAPQDEDEEEAEATTKFYAVKMVAAGGLMKGDKWHLVCQWGREGAEKPGCDVIDFSEEQECKAAFAKVFQEKTKNSWEAGPFAFRTVAGKFTLVDHSDGEEESEDEDESGGGLQQGDFADSMLDEAVQGVVMGMLGKHAIANEVRALEVDTDRLPLRKLKRHAVKEALAELSSIQTILQKGAKQSGNDIKKLALHTERVQAIIPKETSVVFDTVEDLQAQALVLEDLGELCVASAIRKRVMAKKDPDQAAAESAAAEAKKVLALMTRHLTNVIAKAVLEKDTTLTKKVCRERLEEVFGSRVEDNKPFVNAEVARIMAASLGLSEEELGAQIDSSVAVRAEEVGGGGRDEAAELEAVLKLMTRHLTNIITKAMLEKDASLTKKVCRERMEVVFGEQVEENKTFVNEEVGRIMAASRDLSEPELGAQLDSYVAVLSEEVEGVRAADVRASEAPTPNKLDALYRSLHTSMVVLPESDAAVARIKEMVSGSHAAGHDDHSLVVEKVFEIKRAGDEMRYSAFSRLPNKMMLWKGARSSCLAALLAQGLHVPLQEAPSAGYVFGKGVYLQDCASEAARHCSLSPGKTSGLLLLCEAALGTVKETARASGMRRAPHGCHSLLGKGASSYDPVDACVPFDAATPAAAAASAVQCVVGPPRRAFGGEGSPSPFNQYILYDHAQARPRYLVQVAASFQAFQA